MNLGRRHERTIFAPELRTVFGKLGFIGLGRRTHGLGGCRPNLAGAHIAQIDKGAPMISRCVFPPAVDGDAIPTAEA